MRVFAIAAMLVALGGGASAARAAAEGAAAAPAPEFKPVSFGKLAVRLPVGTAYQIVQMGRNCNTTATRTWNGEQIDVKIPAAKETFRDEVQKAGLKVEGDDNSLFESSTPSTSDLVISGLASEYFQRVCAPDTRPESSNMQKGSITLTVDWQLYSRLQKQVVTSAHTTSTYELKDPVSGGYAVMLNSAFADSIRKLVAMPEIRTALGGKALAADELVKPTPESAIGLAGATTTQPRGVDASIGSVVLIRSGDGHGSGFLVSGDGYVLTAAHVVGSASTVRIRWSDKSESDGHVVRVSRGRDVALIKVDVKGHAPLALRQDAPTPGDTVFAIGAPYDQELQGSVTRGVISASRVMQGYTFLQSDVSVGPGVSGGPLLDERGRVIGIAVLGMRIHDAPQGVNLFVPIHDAVTFLSLEPH